MFSRPFTKLYYSCRLVCKQFTMCKKMITFCRGDLFETLYFARRSLEETRERKKNKLEASTDALEIPSEDDWICAQNKWPLCSFSDNFFTSNAGRHSSLQNVLMIHIVWNVPGVMFMMMMREKREREEESIFHFLFRSYSRIIWHPFSSNFILLSVFLSTFGRRQ